MIKVARLSLLGLFNLSVAGCALYGEKNDNDTNASGLILCEEPRPQICTREYNPVCASYNGGSKKTGATDCTSCSDPEVVGYVMGMCEDISVENK